MASLLLPFVIANVLLGAILYLLSYKQTELIFQTQIAQIYTDD